MPNGGKTQKQELLKYLDPKVLSKITRLDLQARLVVEGFISGQHKSPFHGQSVEFASHREYVWGDDIRNVDWKVHARTDRYYIKQYEEETNLKAVFLLDASESMQYGGNGNGLTKYQYAAAVTASLAFLLLQQQDAVGLALFDQTLRSYLPPSANPDRIKSLVHAIDTITPTAKTDLEGVCHSLAEKIPRRGLVCLVSDFFVDDPAAAMRGLRHFQHFGHEVVVLHIMGADELEFPFQGNTQFLGLEDTGRLVADPRALRNGYLDAVGRFCRTVHRGCVAARADYKLISTGEHLDAAMLAFLTARAEAVRKAGAKR